MQRCESFAHWADATPDDFIFAVKGPRYLTHMLKLRNAEAPLGNFFASGVLRLGAKLGPILWQFPANFRFDPDKLETFFEAAAARHRGRRADLGRRHDHRAEGRAWLRSDRRRPIRHAMEIRHESFRDPAFIELLRKHDVALVCADTVEWPLLMDITADFIYVRLHGSTELYRSAYSRAALKRWAARVKAWRDGKPMTDGHFVAAGSRGVARVTSSSISTTPTSCRRPRTRCR